MSDPTRPCPTCSGTRRCQRCDGAGFIDADGMPVALSTIPAPDAERWLPPDERREPINIHPEARDALRRLLMDNKAFRGVGYSEFIMRAVRAAISTTPTCSAIWNGSRCGRPPHKDQDDRHVWMNALDNGRAVDPALYPTAALSTTPAPDLTLCFQPGCTEPGHVSRVHEPEPLDAAWAAAEAALAPNQRLVMWQDRGGPLFVQVLAFDPPFLTDDGEPVDGVMSPVISILADYPSKGLGKGVVVELLALAEKLRESQP